MCTDETIKNALYDKSYTCPLCGEDFKQKTIKSGKNQLVSVDDDLYAHYSLINPLFYDVVICPKCGYSVLAKTFGSLMPTQKKWLGEHFYRGNNLPTYNEYTTLEEAIHKHKIALLACMTRKGKLSEQAYIALNIAWLYRDSQDKINEQAFLRRAFQGFCEAFSKESFPMVGMDAPTITYIIAAIAYEIGEHDESMKYLATIFTETNCPARVKEHAVELKHKLSHHN